MKWVMVITSVVAVLGFVAAGFLFQQGQSIEPSLASTKADNANLESALADIRVKNTELDKERSFYKNTELAKEIELLRLKLDDKEKELTASQKETSDLRDRNTSIAANIKKANAYLNVIDAINKVYLGKPPPPTWDLGDIDAKVSVANDVELTSYWKAVRDSTDTVPGDWSPEKVGKVMARAISKIYSLLR